MSAAAAVQHNARTHSGPPSTRATIAMDGGVADTARANTTPVLTQAVNLLVYEPQSSHFINRRDQVSRRLCVKQKQDHLVPRRSGVKPKHHHRTLDLLGETPQFLRRRRNSDMCANGGGSRRFNVVKSPRTQIRKKNTQFERRRPEFGP